MSKFTNKPEVVTALIQLRPAVIRMLVLVSCMCMASASGQVGMPQLLNEGLTQYAKGKHQESAQSLRDYAAKNPDDARFVYYYVGDCLYQRGEFDDAEYFLKKAMQEGLNKQEATWRLMEIAIREGDEITAGKYKKLLDDQSRQIRLQEPQSLQPRDLYLDTERSPTRKDMQRTIRYYNYGDGHWAEEHGDRLLSVGHLREAIKSYESAIDQHVPIGERFGSRSREVSKLALRLYEKLSNAYRQLQSVPKEKFSDLDLHDKSPILSMNYGLMAFVLRIKFEDN